MEGQNFTKIAVNADELICKVHIRKICIHLGFFLVKFLNLTASGNPN